MTEIEVRVERFERRVALCQCILPTLFSLQLLAVGLAAPLFSRLYADYGAPLPILTSFAIGFGPLWIGLGIAVPVVCVVLARWLAPAKSVLLCGVTGLAMFVAGQAALVGLFLPLLELAKVAGP